RAAGVIAAGAESPARTGGAARRVDRIGGGAAAVAVASLAAVFADASSTSSSQPATSRNARARLAREMRIRGSGSGKGRPCSIAVEPRPSTPVRGFQYPAPRYRHVSRDAASAPLSGNFAVAGTRPCWPPPCLPRSRWSRRPPRLPDPPPPCSGPSRAPPATAPIRPAQRPVHSRLLSVQRDRHQPGVRQCRSPMAHAGLVLGHGQHGAEGGGRRIADQEYLVPGLVRRSDERSMRPAAEDDAPADGGDRPKRALGVAPVGFASAARLA